MLAFSLAALFLFYLLCGAVGYGNDGDSYAMLRSGLNLLEHGIYLPSRSPGYPLPELLIGAGSRDAGHWGSNALSSLAACAAVACGYFLLCEQWGRSRAFFSAAVVGLNPYWIIAASSSMDYAYAAAFFMIGLVMLRRRNLHLAACCFAACAASRLTYVPAILLVYLALARWRREDFPPSRILTSAVLFLGLAWLAYLPVYHAVGRDMFKVNISDQHVDFLGLQGFASLKLYLERFFYKNLLLWGIPSCMFLLAAGVWRRPIAARGKGLSAPVVWTAWAAFFYFEALFLRLPLEISYLIPVLFLGVLLLNGTVHSRLLLAGMLACQLLQCLVTFDFMQPVYSRHTLDGVEGSGFKFQPGFRRGVLWEDLSQRRIAQKHYIPLFFDDTKNLRP